jgi:hypothetical protein
MSQDGGDEGSQIIELQSSQQKPVVPQPGTTTATQGRKGSKKPPDYPCLACGKNVTSNAVQCTLCAQWCHRTCTTLSAEGFKALEIQKRECGMAFWGCRSCMGFSLKVNNQLQEAMRRQDVVEEKVESFARNMDQRNGEMDRLKEELKKLRIELDNVKMHTTDSMGRELRDRDMRKNNIVIHGVAEPDESIRFNRDRIEQDKISCSQLFARIGVNTRQSDIRFCRRVGEKGRNPRPIVIGLNSEAEKKCILERARSLRGTEYDNVAMVPDMTRLQRRTEDNLVLEAANRNRQLTADDISKNLKWLVVGKHGEKRLIKGMERDQQSYARTSAQLQDYIPTPPQPQPSRGTTRGRGNTSMATAGSMLTRGGPTARASTASNVRGGGVGRGNAHYTSEYDLGARRRDTYPEPASATSTNQQQLHPNPTWWGERQRAGQGRQC